jgi:hypothetical protein
MTRPLPLRKSQLFDSRPPTNPNIIAEWSHRPLVVVRMLCDYAIVLLDQAGWDSAKTLVVPSNVSFMPLPPRAPELNGQEKTSGNFMGQN